MIIIDGKLATPSDPWVKHCGFCGRPESVCDNDAHGCGTTPAEDDSAPVTDYHLYHSDDCGTKYRGCAPDCPKDTWEHTGVWIGPSGWRDRAKLT